MFTYYFHLALGSLRRNIALTALMIVAIGVGIGASMTTLAVFRAMSGDPIPRKSGQLFMVQIDSWGPNKPGVPSEDNLKDSLSYIDVSALMHAHAAKRQTPIYSTVLKGRAADSSAAPFQIVAPAVSSDFFAMFDAPFAFGGPWTRADDAAAAPVAVIPRKLNDKLFGGANSVGKTLLLDGSSYRIVGVLDRWPLVPRFYNLHVGAYANVDELFFPFTRAISSHAAVISGTSCQFKLVQAWDELIASECLWMQFWAELPTRADADNYRTFLNNYAADQQRAGRFRWPPHTQMRNVRQWLKYQHIVPSELSILVLTSFAFLFVCLMNAMGLMLAKIMTRMQDIGVRRALGASRRAIAAQCLVESAVIGILGALLGLVLTMLGVLLMRAVFAEGYARLTYITVPTVTFEVVLAIAATMLAALYPTWRAAHVEPALQLKAE
jgi:putative ABC transport system permease protein